MSAASHAIPARLNLVLLFGAALVSVALLFIGAYRLPGGVAATVGAVPSTL